MFACTVLQSSCRERRELGNAQGIAADGKRTCLVLHDAYPTGKPVAVMCWWVIWTLRLLRLLHSVILCVCASMVNNTQGLTNSYVLPSCCTTCLSIDGFIVHARI